MTSKKTERDIEKEIEKNIEKNITKFFEKELPKKLSNSIGLKIFGEIILYIFLLILILFIFPKLPFVTDEYYYYQQFAFLATTISSFFRILKHISKSNTLKRVYEIGDNLSTLFSTYMLIEIYPIDFSVIGFPNMNTFFRNILYLIMLIISVVIIINFIRIFFQVKANK